MAQSLQLPVAMDCSEVSENMARFLGPERKQKDAAMQDQMKGTGIKWNVGRY